MEKTRIINELGGTLEGILEPNESVEMVIDIENTGSFMVNNAKINLKNLSGKQIEIELPKQNEFHLKPGENQVHSYKLKISNDLQNSTISLGLMVESEDFLFPYFQNISLQSVPVESNKTASKALMHWGLYEDKKNCSHIR